MDWRVLSSNLSGLNICRRSSRVERTPPSLAILGTKGEMLLRKQKAAPNLHEVSSPFSVYCVGRRFGRKPDKARSSRKDEIKVSMHTMFPSSSVCVVA